MSIGTFFSLLWAAPTPVWRMFLVWMMSWCVVCPHGHLQQMEPATSSSEKSLFLSRCLWPLTWSRAFPPTSWYKRVKGGTIVVIAEQFGSCHRGRGRAALRFTTCQDRVKTFKQDPAEDYRQISGVLSENLKHFWGRWAFLKRKNKTAKQPLSWSNSTALFPPTPRALSAWGDNRNNDESVKTSSLSVTVIVSTWSSFAHVNWTFLQFFIDVLISHNVMSQTSNQSLSFLDMEAGK